MSSDYRNSIKNCEFNIIIIDFLIQFSFIDFWHFLFLSLRSFYTKFLAPIITHSFYKHNCYDIYSLKNNVESDVLLYKKAVDRKEQQNEY